MARFIGDQATTGWKYNSGLYASVSGTEQWAGLVQSAEIVDATNQASARFVNGTTRDVEQSWNQAVDSNYNFTTWPQDWRMVAFALGSVVTAGSPYVHTITAVNNDSSNAFTSGTDAPFMSFDFQTAKQFNPTGLNHIKTANGCVVDSLTLNWSEGEPISMEVAGVAQKTAYTSGAAWAPTANTERPYMWSDTTFKVSCTAVMFVKSATFSIANNMQANHYVNGSVYIELPYPTNRDYELSLTVDSNTDQAKQFYEEYFMGGSEFNSSIVVTRSAVRTATFTLSGCTVTDMKDPQSFSGGQEQTITIKPKTCNAVVTDGIAKYGAW